MKTRFGFMKTAGLLLGVGMYSVNGLGAENPFLNSSDITISEADKVSLVFSGNIQGYIGPCGCAFNPKGGLDRRFEFLKKRGFLETKNKSIVLDSGNALFPALNLDPGQEKNLKEKAAIILKAHQKMRIGAANVGYLDLAAGLDFLKSITPSDYPWISTNIRNSDGKTVFAPKKELTLNGLKLVVFGLTESVGLSKDWTVEDPIKSLNAELKTVDKTSLVVVLSDLSVRQNETLRKKISRPFLLLGGRDLSSLELPIQQGNKAEFRTQIQGQQWGVVELNMAAKQIERWFSPSIGKKFSERWSSLQKQKAALKDLPRSSDRKFEMEKLEATEDDILEYAPSDKNNTATYEYSLTDLGEEYKKNNELSEWVKKYQ